MNHSVPRMIHGVRLLWLRRINQETVLKYGDWFVRKQTEQDRAARRVKYVAVLVL